VGVGHSGAVTPNLFCVSENFVVLRKQKSFPLNMYFSPQTLKPGYGPDSAKIVSAIKVFWFDGFEM